MNIETVLSKKAARKAIEDSLMIRISEFQWSIKQPLTENETRNKSKEDEKAMIDVIAHSQKMISIFQKFIPVIIDLEDFDLVRKGEEKEIIERYTKNKIVLSRDIVESRIEDAKKVHANVMGSPLATKARQDLAKQDAIKGLDDLIESLEGILK